MKLSGLSESNHALSCWNSGKLLATNIVNPFSVASQLASASMKKKVICYQL